MSKVAGEKRAEGSGTRKLWTQEEELLVAECCIQISEDPNIGSEQKSETFWHKVLDQYNGQAKISKFPVCTKNMLTGKWTSMNRMVGRFNLLVLETRVMSEENDDDWMKMVEIMYKSVTFTKFKHKSAWLFLKDKHKWKNPDSINARQNQERVTDEEPELFGDDEFPRPPDKQKLAKSQRSTNSSASFGSNPTMFQDMLQQQYELDRKEKIERMDRETAAR
ncbi:hypothetical protein Tco_1040945 [Tanacetum coccineum]|uniref:Myb-like domain-containing protein n=1 Tax=Tanacetum coccineum TaxID=301880 RepID=A0ABQ5GG94_9ASTR